MKEIMCTHVTKRGSVYYYRRKTPKHLISIFGTQVMFSLNTKDPKEANVLGRKHGVHYDDLFASASAKLAGGLVTSPPIPRPQSHRIKAPSFGDGLNIEDSETYAFLYLKKLRVLRDKAAATDKWAQFNDFLNKLIDDAEDYLKSGIHPFDDNPEPLWKHEAKLKAARHLKEFKDLPFTESILQASKNVAAVKPTITKHLLKELVIKWAEERIPAEKTVAKMNRIVDRFIAVTDVSDATKVTKSHCIAFKDSMLDKGSTPANINQYLNELKIILNFAKSQAIIDNNPAIGLKILFKESAKNKRQSFDIPALNKVFSSPIYANAARPVGGKGEAAYWLPLLALYTGARFNELCQILTGDIYQASYHDEKAIQHDCWVIELTNEGEDQKLKNEGSRRIVPVHSVLIEFGFIKYVQSLPTGQIFPLLTMSQTFSSLSANWSKWFGRYLREVMQVDDKRLVFHSFRHTFKDYCRDASIASEIHHALTGHSSGNAGDNYGSDLYPLRPLVEAIAKYKVTGLVLPQPPPKL